jgi:hypothetical protein
MEARPQVAPVRRTGGAGGLNSIVDILSRADYEAFGERLADDVVFHSPVAHFTFRGRDITSAQIERLVKQSDLDHWRVQSFTKLEADVNVVAVSTMVRGHKLDLLTVTRLNERFQMRELTVYARPMASIAIFPAFVYPHLVSLFRGRARGALVRLLFRPLPGILKFVTHAGLGLGQPPECEFEAKRAVSEQPADASAGPRSPSAGPRPPSAGPRSPFRRL